MYFVVYLGLEWFVWGDLCVILLCCWCCVCWWVMLRLGVFINVWLMDRLFISWCFVWLIRILVWCGWLLRILSLVGKSVVVCSVNCMRYVNVCRLMLGVWLCWFVVWWLMGLLIWRNVRNCVFVVIWLKFLVGRRFCSVLMMWYVRFVLCVDLF